MASMTATGFTFEEAAGDRFGASITDVADLDTDGVLDFAVGAPLHDGPAGADAGRVYVYSGATGAFLRAIDGAAAGGQLGRTLEDCGDVDGDGAGDLIAGGVGSATV
ncbi:MAG: FG-GAP repeat protein, partial [Myxococcales bacterium]|nr:FG-GAP repeat protein [Myxococcales bacterium]